MTTDPSPKLPFWVFVASDIALLAAAWLIAEYSQHPLSPAAVAGITSCAALGTLVLLVPILLRYERQKNEVLDDRQRSLEGIARTVHESAEQLSIAANGLNQIAGLTRQSLQTAEALPEKLKTELAAFDSKTASANDAERGRLEKELAALRKTNSDQLAHAASQLVQVTGEWTKLESAAREQLARANETLRDLDRGAATQITAAHAAALAELDARIKALAERATAVISAVPTAATSNPPASAALPEPIAPSAAITEPAVQTGSEAVVVAPTEAPATIATPAPKRPRKPRRETPAEPATAAPTPTAEAPSPTAPAEITPVAPEPAPAAAAAVTPDVITAPTTEASPAATPSVAVVNIDATSGSAEVGAEPSPATAPSSNPESSNPKEESSAPTEIAVTPPEPAPAPAESPRKRASRAKPEATPEPMLDLAIDDSAPPVRAMERGLSSDGATRMIVTAYIGIGNRLFIRGEGPGLSPDKGVPLQFVSIGKWRWETNDATAPIRFRILKNDSVECTGLGEQTLEPGYQAEFGASF